jgi:hypothetical protein
MAPSRSGTPSMVCACRSGSFRVGSATGYLGSARVTRAAGPTVGGGWRASLRLRDVKDPGGASYATGGPLMPALERGPRCACDAEQHGTGTEEQKGARGPADRGFPPR